MRNKTITTEWDTTATVRSRPCRQLSQTDWSEKWLYSQELVPILMHPLLAGLDHHTLKNILARTLVNHLNFTNYLEHDIINQVVFHLARDPIIDLSIAMRRDAHRIYVDEAYHSLLVSDLRFQVEDLIGIQTPNSPPSFYWDIKKIISQVPPQLREKALLCVAIVSETLISKLLQTLPKDDSVAQGVREVITDHAHDEAYHHRYFTQIFQVAWPQLTETEKTVLGCLFPKYIYSFLAPDYCFLQSCLVEIGLSTEQARQVIRETYKATDVAQDIKVAATSPLKLFQRYGLFDDDQIAAAFAELNLLPDTAKTTS